MSEIGRNNDRASENNQLPDVHDQRALSQHVQDQLRVQQTSDQVTAQVKPEASDNTSALAAKAEQHAVAYRKLPEGDPNTPGGDIGTRNNIRETIAWHIENTPPAYQAALHSYRNTVTATA